MASRTFKYVDKDRLIPVLDDQILEYTELLEEIGDDDYIEGKVSMLKRIRSEVLNGYYDWQPAE
ncbi:MAG: hypothetical protein WC444_07460 [Candidatus Paceibacterota bacterium]